eukprot:GHRR01031832.1.p2 GENE.GHRR01031832.1~~GHRR01031832.1.p2  ORF type:complete len:127 (+),score=10.63 GHRR01031832.1:386-766(+)
MDSGSSLLLGMQRPCFPSAHNNIVAGIFLSCSGCKTVISSLCSVRMRCHALAGPSLACMTSVACICTFCLLQDELSGWEAVPTPLWSTFTGHCEGVWLGQYAAYTPWGGKTQFTHSGGDQDYLCSY